MVKEALAEAEFESTKAGGPNVTIRGVHYARWYTYKPAVGEPALGCYNGSEDRILKAIQTALTPLGWQIVL